MSQQPLNSSQSHQLSVLLALMSEYGISKQQLFEHSETSDLPSAPSLNSYSLLNSALRLSGDPQLGLKYGRRINIAEQGAFGYAMMTSSTVEEALKVMVHYNQAILPNLNTELELSEKGLSILLSGPHLSTELEQFYCEVLYAAVISNGAMLIGENKLDSVLELQGSPNCDLKHYHAIFGPNVVFQSHRSALTLSPESLALSISNANPLVQTIFRRECDRLLGEEHRFGNLSSRVKQILLEAGSEFPTAAEVAHRLNISESTLQRRLNKEDVKFQQLLDQVRTKLALEYLTSTNLPVTDIAWLVGFSDAANFRRSFKRWTNLTPQEMRSNNTSLTTSPAAK